MVTTYTNPTLADLMRQAMESPQPPEPVQPALPFPLEEVIIECVRMDANMPSGDNPYMPLGVSVQLYAAVFAPERKVIDFIKCVREWSKAEVQSYRAYKDRRPILLSPPDAPALIRNAISKVNGPQYTMSLRDARDLYDALRYNVTLFPYSDGGLDDPNYDPESPES